MSEQGFFPMDYEKPSRGSRYLNSFPAGDTKFRIVSEAIVGWQDWLDRKPVRTKEKPEISNDPLKPAKHFWSFVIWDYSDATVKIMTITQATLQDAIYDLANDVNWGDPRGYDIIVKKTGDKLETKYIVMPVPPKAIDESIKTELEKVKVTLDALYAGDDPFDSLGNNSIDLENLPF
jgi:hypothetical protein